MRKIKTDHTYNGGGAGSVTAYYDGSEVSLDVYVDEDAYDLDLTSMISTPVDGLTWDNLPENVQQAISIEAKKMQKDV